VFGFGLFFGLLGYEDKKRDDTVFKGGKNKK